MDSIAIRFVNSRIGELIVGVFEGQLCLLDFRYRKMRKAVDERLKRHLNADFVEADHPLMDEALKQLDEYLDGERKEFSLPLLFAGSDFQKEVWRALLKVRYGETSTYAAQSERMGRPDAVRAVAAANGANAMSIFVPCHRIVGSDGNLVGYAGGLPLKKRLLLLEKGINFDFKEEANLRKESGQTKQHKLAFD